MMDFRRALILAVLVFPMLSAARAAEGLPETERFSVTTGLPLAEGVTPAGEAIMTVYHPERGNGVGVLIFPGGGYGGLAKEPEGFGIARWFREHGVTGAVVEYRMPGGNPSIPLSDAQRATRIVRANAAAWKIDPAKVGTIGFSAGGHLASTIATHFDKGNAKAADPIERQSCRPDFCILIYPVITMGEKAHGGSRENLLGKAPDAKALENFSSEKQVTRDTPPAFLAHALNDKLVSSDNSKMYYQALRKNRIAAEYLELPSGDHGLDGYQGPMWEAWKTGSLKWLAKQKFIPAADAK